MTLEELAQEYIKKKEEEEAKERERISKIRENLWKEFKELYPVLHEALDTSAVYVAKFGYNPQRGWYFDIRKKDATYIASFDVRPDDCSLYVDTLEANEELILQILVEKIANET